MTAQTTAPQQKKSPPWRSLLSQLDGLGILAWGVLLLKYFFTGELKLLIHPNYFALVGVTGLVLLFLGGIRTVQTVEHWLRRSPNQAEDTVTHVTVLPLGLGSLLLLLTAIAGLVITPTVFSSQLALQRGISNTLSPTQVQTKSFAGGSQNPEERTLVDWIRTINAYPEPDVYAGQKADFSGFVVYPDYLPDNYFLIGRFILTCCAVDAYPIALPVKLSGSREQYPQDSWLQIQGEMISETLPVASGETKRQVVLEAKTLETIPTPPDPYSYAE